jgi:rhamnose transport system ATP-binding protein
VNAPLIQVRYVGKAFGGVQALAEVSLDIAPGEVHALVGENGAGKSTLIKILSGIHAPDDGEVLVGGVPLALGDVAASEAAGIAVVHQEPTSFPHLSAADNIFVGREPRRLAGLALDRPRMRRETLALMERLGERVDPRAAVGELPYAQRQMVAIARALARRCRLLIMDEPTASLSAREAEVLFRIIRGLREAGISVLYVSHRLEEVFELSDRLTVLRDGRLVRTCPTADVNRDGLIRMMVGRELTDYAGGPWQPPRTGNVLLDVRGLGRRGAFEDVSFSVRAGEIVGLAGLVGAGRSEVARAIFGIDRPDTGTVAVGGRPLAPGSPQQAIRRGVALVPEDRQRFGIIPAMSVAANMTLAVMRQLARWIFRSPAREREVVERLMKDLAVRAAGPDVAAETLSGGNQQKVVIGKWLAVRPKVLLLDEPTAGVDVGAKAEVHRLIRRLASEGCAAVLISSELPEILSMSDRILVMRGGAIVGELGHAEATQEKVLAMALGE